MGRYKENYTLFKRGKYWYYRTYDARGVRTTAKTTGQTNKTLAKEYCEHLYLTNTLCSSSLTFGEYSRHYLDSDSPFITDRVKPLSDNSLKSYKTALNIHLLPALENKKIADINYTFLKRYRSDLINSLKPSSIKIILFLFQNIMQSAYRDGLINNNPFDLLETLQFDTESRDAFTRSEVVQLYHNIAEPYKKIVLFCALTGTRINECVSIRAADVMNGDGFVYVHLTKQLIKGKWTSLKTKEVRNIPIIPELIKYIWNDDFFPHTDFYKELKKVTSTFTDYEQRMLSTHSLRHFFITDTKSKNLNANKIEVIVGHSLKGMQGIYTNFKVEDLTDILSWQSDLYKELIG